MLFASEYLSKVGVGVTAPVFIQGNDHKVYVVKLQSNRLGPKVLVSEFLAAGIGKILELCFPPSQVMTITPEFLQNSPELQELGVVPGRHFASEYITPSVYLDRRNVKCAANIKEMAGVVLFDHLFHNADRTMNRKNLLLCKEKDEYKIYAIDNSHLFRSGAWTPESVQTLSGKIRIYYRYLFGLLLKDTLSPDDFLTYVHRISEVTDEQIVQLLQSIPEEWLTEKNELETLAQYIRTRRDMVDEIWFELCKYIPKARGGQRCLCGNSGAASDSVKRKKSYLLGGKRRKQLPK